MKYMPKKRSLSMPIAFVILVTIMFINILDANKALAVERLKKADFDCTLLKTSKSKKGVNLCLQKVQMIDGQDMVMGQYELGGSDILIRITDDMDANRDRIVHELFHYVTTKYASSYSSKELITYVVQEDMAYEITYLFSESNKILLGYK